MSRKPSIGFILVDEFRTNRSRDSDMINDPCTDRMQRTKLMPPSWNESLRQSGTITRLRLQVSSMSCL